MSVLDCSSRRWTCQESPFSVGDGVVSRGIKAPTLNQLQGIVRSDLEGGRHLVELVLPDGERKVVKLKPVNLYPLGFIGPRTQSTRSCSSCSRSSLAASMEQEGENCCEICTLSLEEPADVKVTEAVAGTSSDHKEPVRARIVGCQCTKFQQYHWPCLVQWLQRRCICPICREVVCVRSGMIGYLDASSSSCAFVETRGLDGSAADWTQTDIPMPPRAQELERLAVVPVTQDVLPLLGEELLFEPVKLDLPHTEGDGFNPYDSTIHGFLTSLADQLGNVVTPYSCFDAGDPTRPQTVPAKLRVHVNLEWMDEEKMGVLQFVVRFSEDHEAVTQGLVILDHDAVESRIDIEPGLNFDRVPNEVCPSLRMRERRRYAMEKDRELSWEERFAYHMFSRSFLQNLFCMSGDHA